MSVVSPVDKYITVNGLRLHYLDWGNAEGKQSLLLLHGLTGHAHFWDFFARSLREEFHILALSQRGHGDSEWAKDGYATERFASDIDKFAELLGLDKFVLIGLSLGGRNAMAFASDHSPRLDNLVLVDIGPGLPTRGATVLPTTRTVYESEEDALAQMMARYPRFSREFAYNRMYYGTRRREDGKMEPKYDELGLAQRNPVPLWDAIKRISCPTLLLRGTASDVLSGEVALQMEETIPNCRLVEIDAGHSIPGDNPADFEKAVRAFLKV